MAEGKNKTPATDAIDSLISQIFEQLPNETDKADVLQQITIILRSSGNRDRDKQRIKAIYSTLISFPGRDRFSFQIFEQGKGHLIDFPNDTTRVGPELLERLKQLLDKEDWRVDNLIVAAESGASVNTLVGDSTTDAPPPDVSKKKKRKGK